MKHNGSLFLALALLCLPSIAEAGGLRGSPSSMKEQHAVAVERELTFMGDAAQVEASIESGALDSVKSNGDFTLAGVSYPYAVAEVRLFIERLGRQYFDANGQPLVVTSLTRPAGNQPRNAHELSVHPAGMAVDFRVPRDAEARAWLENVLLQLENRGVLDVTREKYPPHYHVAVYPAAYRAYVETLPPLPARPVAETLPSSSEEETVVRAVPVVGPDASVNASATDGSGLLLLIVGMSGVAFTALLARRGQPI